MRKIRSLAGGLAALAVTGLAAAPTEAHHSFAMFDGTQFLVFTGVVYQVSPDANHLQIFFIPLNEQRNDIVRNADGTYAVWVVEGAGAAGAANQGITVLTFPPGTVFSTGLHPLRDGSPGGDRGSSGLFKCPTNPETGLPVLPGPGLHCDSVEGATAHGGGVIPAPGPLEVEATTPAAGL